MKEKAMENARDLVEYITKHAVELAIVRHSLVAAYGEELDEDAIVTDIAACMVGDYCGCLDPDDPLVLEVVNRVEAFAVERGHTVLREAESRLRDRANATLHYQQRMNLRDAADLLAEMANGLSLKVAEGDAS